MTKRLIRFAAFAMVLCLAVSAAATELSWNQICTWKTSEATTLYVKLSEDSDELTASSSLPAGTYIKIAGERGQGPEGTTYIAYSANNSDPLYGYIDNGAIKKATISVKLDDGNTMSVPEALQNSLAAFMYYLEMHGATCSSGEYTDSEGNVHKFGNEKPYDGDNPDGDARWADGMDQAAIENGAYTPTFYKAADGTETEVPVEYMGLSRSMITLDGEKTLVDTTSLSWQTEAPEEKVLAVVTSPNYARLRAKKSKKSLIMDKVNAGTVIRVLKIDKSWTFVDYNGIRGYILSSQLEFHPNEPYEYRAGYVSTKSGHTYGNSTVHVRDNPKGKQREEYLVGTPITVLEDDGKWCRIEVRGHLCYIQRKFMVYEDDLQKAASENGA